MFKDCRKDIYDLDSGFIGVYVDKIRVLIVGGGRVGYLKAKGLLNQGIRPDIVSRDFIEDFNTLNIPLIKGK
ncbi:NAD(P)-dependent oxidoreductase [Caloramator sp. mosi_1]|uniref:NAD(P)-dependent oxidoreductase n=1 Tax=Caloramator sp. mosi_1 TaxID=3023090 RepID=UPI0023630EB0|nr:NAD(P)-dependent oxidoreductase [Caloramator sp. mosi_1]WDC84906.1 NAD(P)-dependent oxidoreductase [Caloramator sp. mosi_1]